MSDYVGKIQIGSTTYPVGSTFYGVATAPETNTVMYTANGGNLTNLTTLLPGLTAHIKFAASNTYANPTLKIGNFDAKPIHRIAGTAVGTTETTSWPAGAIVALTYDGTAWVINSATDNNTTYTITEGTTNGTIAVSVNGGTATNVSVHGLGSAAYTNSSAYAASDHNHNGTYARLDGATFTGTVLVPTVTSESNASAAATKDYVDTVLSTGLGTAEAMVFKGTLGTGGTITALPTGTTGQTYKQGWTYKVITAGTYGGHVCEVGDLLIALQDSINGQTAANGDHWTVAQGNIDGSVTTTGGTAGALAKFSSNSTLVDGPAFTSGATGFLKQDGTWATPTDTRDPGYGQVTVSAQSTATTGLTGQNSAVTVSSASYNEILKLTTANKWIVATATSGTNDNPDEIQIAHAVPASITDTAPNAAQTGLTYGGTFNIPKIAYDAAGHITGVSALTVTLPASDNTDEKVKQSPYSTATNSEFNILFKHSAGDTEETDSVYYSTVTADSNNRKLTFNPSTGTLTAKNFSGTFTGTLSESTLGTDSTVTTDKIFFHKSGAWKLLSISNTTTTIASVANGVLTLKSTVNDSAALTMSDPSTT